LSTHGDYHLTEDIFTNNVAQIEKIYSILIKGESNPQQEVEMRIELIDALSNLEASLISEKIHNQEFIVLLTNLREALLGWDPYGQWFRQQKDLVDAVYQVIINAKNVVFVKNQEASSEATRLKKELSALKSELSDLRSLMNKLVTDKKDTPQEIPSPPIEQPIVEPTTPTPPPTEETTTKSTSRLPWKRETTSTPEEPSKEFEPKDEPLSMLPVESPPESIETTPVSEPPIVTEEEEAKTIVSDKTLEKLEKSSEATSSSVLSQMKTLINEAEKETEKQLSEMKEKYQPSTITPPTTPDEIPEPPPITSEPIAPPLTAEETSTPEATDNDWVKPSEILKQKEAVESTSTADPYMQLLTLEAEKYRLEKEIEKNETDFQEGLKSKQEFDATIDRINTELATIREQIDSLRKQLTS
jgi:hypothetical protein